MFKHSLALIIFLACLTSCEKSSYYSEFQKLDGSWDKDSIVEFSFQAPDTIQKYDFFIHIKNTKNYKYNNLFLITSMQFPYGKVIVDTLEYKMAYKDGRLMGEGIGSLKHNKLWYKEHLKFTERGEYKFEVRQAMRQANKTNTINKLEGIEEVGFSFEAVNPNKS